MRKQYLQCVISNNGDTYCFDTSALSWFRVSMVPTEVKALPTDVIMTASVDAYGPK